MSKEWVLETQANCFDMIFVSLGTTFTICILPDTGHKALMPSVDCGVDWGLMRRSSFASCSAC